MNRSNDIEGLLDRWLAEGPSEAPGRVVEVVGDRIERQSQRPAWRLRWREIPVNAYLKPLAAVAAVVVIAVVGINLLGGPGRSSVGGPAATPSPSPSPASSPSPSPSAAFTCEDDLPGCAGPLGAGQHSSVNFGPKLTYTTPAGWTNSIDTGTILKLDPSTGRAPSILIWTGAKIADQTASCDPVATKGVGRTAQDWIAYITSHPGLDATAPVPVEMGGQVSNAKSVDVSVAADWTTICPTHAGPYVMLIATASGGDYGVPNDQRLHLIVLDVGGETVIIEVYGPKAPTDFAATMAIAQPVIDSFKFGCGPSVGRPCGTP